MITLSGIPIDPDECIGDSLIAINESFIELDSRTKYLLSAVSLSSIDTDTIDLDRDATFNTLSANIKNASVTNAKIAFDGDSFTHRNKLINGDCFINQRTRGSVLNIPLNTVSRAKNYVIDRWSCECAPQPAINYAEIVAYQSSDAPVGFTDSVAVSVAVAQTNVTPLVNQDTRASVSQTLELKDIVDLQYGTPHAKSLTLSFWAKSNFTGNYTGQIKTFSETNINKSYLFSYTLSSTDWERKTVTIPGDTDPLLKLTANHFLTASNGPGMSVEFNIGSGNDYGITLTSPPGDWRVGDILTLDSFTGAFANIVQVILLPGCVFKITGVQLEKGNTSTPFEHRPVTTESLLCKRYFETSYPLNTNPGTILAAPFNREDGFEFYDLSRFVYSTTFQTEKRVTPVNSVSFDPNTGVPNQANVREIGTTACTSMASVAMPYPNTSQNKVSFDVSTAGILYSSYYGLLHWVADSEFY